MLATLIIASRSAVKFVGLALNKDLKLVRRRLGKEYRVEGGTYAIFRETEKTSTKGETVVLVIGFRLKFIRSSSFFHWFFQRICILTTPFWCGLPGFKTKLWMVDPSTKNYLGIYDWRGKQQAHNYVDFLMPILRFFSVSGSVWEKRLDVQDLEYYLTQHTAKL